MGRVCWLVILSVVALVFLGGCASKHHPPEVDTSWITAMTVIVGQDAGQPISLTLVESEVTRHLYQQFRLVTASQLAAALGEYRLTRPMLFDPATCAEIGRLTGVDAILQVTVTSHEIEFSRAGHYRAHVGLAMQLIEVPTGTVHWSRSARRSRSADTISVAVHETVSGAVQDCIKYLTGWKSIVKQGSTVDLCSRTGLELDQPAGSAARGVRVQKVAPDSVWERAGLRAGDVISSANGQSLDAPAVEWLGNAAVSEVSLTVRRGEALVELTVPVDWGKIPPVPTDHEK